MNFDKIKEENPFTFTSNLVKKSVYIRDINKDIDRTFPEDQFFQEEQKYELHKAVCLNNNLLVKIHCIVCCSQSPIR